jgi:hypothetical protein
MGRLTLRYRLQPIEICVASLAKLDEIIGVTTILLRDIGPFGYTLETTEGTFAGFRGMSLNPVVKATILNFITTPPGIFFTLPILAYLGLVLRTEHSPS